MHTFTIGNATFGGDHLAVIAGPCVIESLDLCREVAAQAKAICDDLGLGYVFKASFDKANRTAGGSYRGTGLAAGLEVLAAIKGEFGIPVVTDIHESWQATPVAEVVDMLQIPAFLCRQTDLLLAAAETGAAVNVKKGQFLAPWDMQNVVDKLEGAGCEKIILTERGASFGYNTLVVDMTALPQMRDMGWPVCFDGTHSTQLPGGAGKSTGGRREMVPCLTRSAVAAGVDALFLEVHPNPELALSDAATMLRLADLRPLLEKAIAIDAIVRGVSTDEA
jgi:2-dehydro-3-deoxyphosphooctonate aldolase (KDO 8-P synthase)